MLSLECPNIFQHAYNQTKRIDLHSTTQPPVQEAATEIVGLLHFFFFFWWGLLHGPQQGPDRMKEKTYKTWKRKTPA